MENMPSNACAPEGKQEDALQQESTTLDVEPTVLVTRAAAGDQKTQQHSSKVSKEKYESLKAQFEKSNQEMQLLREQHESEIHKLKIIIRRLKIKYASLAASLDDEKKEYSALDAFCDELIGKM